MKRDELLTELARLAIRQNRMLATAESCTGGGVAKALTEIAGSSAWFTCGLVTYSNQAKQALLGVRPETLAAHGAVSEAVVREMVIGACQRGTADLAVAVSGVAGPGGGSAEKPVGCVWLAWGNATRQHAAQLHFHGDRHAIREASIDRALQGLLDELQQST